MRVACVYAPQLALQAVLRREPERRSEAIVLADGGHERSRVVGLTRAAEHVGVRRGLTVNQARAAASALRVAVRVVVVSPADTAAAQAALADVGYAFAPRVEAEPGRVFLEVGDLGREIPSISHTGSAQPIRLGAATGVGYTRV